MDARQINLTRFELFFPEKRTFFLEGAGVFDVAGPWERRTRISSRSSAEPIGLLNGQEVPILSGLKVTGRQAGLNVGVLDVQTRDDDPRRGTPGGAEPARGPGQQEPLRAVLDRRHRHARQPHGRRRQQPRRRRRPLRDVPLQGRQEPEPLPVRSSHRRRRLRPGSDYAYGFKLDYPNDLWNATLSWKRIGDDFNPAMGFVPRTGIRRTDLYVAFQPRPERWGIRQFFFELEPTYDHQPAGPGRELERLHRALQRPNRVGRAPRVELHPDLRAPRRAVRDPAGRGHSSGLVLLGRAFVPR